MTDRILPKGLNAWGRRSIIALAVTLSSGLYLSVWAEGFRISASVILYPLLLVSMMRDSHTPDTGWFVGLWVTVSRVAMDLIGGAAPLPSLLREYPGGVFYFCYDLLLCLLLRDRRSATPLRLWGAFFLCDLISNSLNLFLSSRGAMIPPVQLLTLALVRSGIAACLTWAVQNYRQFLLREEHESRYRRLFLMTANLKTELYFLKKDAEDIESVMANAYRLYEKLEKSRVSEELSSLALSIARDVHEVKKDNLRIIRGLDEAVAEAYDADSLSLSDVLQILEVTTRQFLGSQRANIRLECRQLAGRLSICEHYRILSVLKNLVTNAVEAIQAGSGRGLVQVECRREGEELLVKVTDDGPGISARAQEMLFQVGYSTKFNPDTGNINRGVGLPAVQYIVEELEGTICVSSELGKGACFQVALPLKNIVTGGAV